MAGEGPCGSTRRQWERNILPCGTARREAVQRTRGVVVHVHWAFMHVGYRKAGRQITWGVSCHSVRTLVRCVFGHIPLRCDVRTSLHSYCTYRYLFSIRDGCHLVSCGRSSIITIGSGRDPFRWRSFLAEVSRLSFPWRTLGAGGLPGSVAPFASFVHAHVLWKLLRSCGHQSPHVLLVFRGVGQPPVAQVSCEETTAGLAPGPRRHIVVISRT